MAKPGYVWDGSQWVSIYGAVTSGGGEGSSSPYETVTVSSSTIPSGSPSAPTVVSTSSQDANGNTSMTFTLPSSMQSGDLCIILIGSDTTQPALPSGWTDLSAITYGSGFQRTIYKVMSGTPESTVSLTGLSSSGATAVSIAIRNYTGTPSITTATGSTGMPDAPSVTTTANNSLVIALGALDDDSVTTVTAPTGYINLVQEDATARTGMTTMLATKVVSTAGAENPTAFTGAGDDEWYAATIVISPAGTPVNFDVSTSQINYYTSSVTSDCSINFRGDTSTTLNSLLTNGQSVTCAILLTTGSTPYVINAVTVDSVAVGIKWLGGSVPTGVASSIESYVFTIIKTATNTYTVLGSKSRYA